MSRIKPPQNVNPKTGKATFITNSKEEKTDGVYRQFGLRNVISVQKTDAVQWVNEGDEIVFARNGKVLTSFKIFEITKTDLTKNNINSLPNSYSGTVINYYSA